MARGHTVPAPLYHPEAPAARENASARCGRSREIGYRGLLLLAFALPFDMEQRPLLWTNYLTVTNLTVLVVVVAALAMITVAELAMDAVRGSRCAAEYFYRRRLPFALIAAFLLSSIVSTVLARSSTQSVTWLLGVLTGALLWLVLPLWLGDDPGVRVRYLGTAIVAGAIVTGLIGLVEIAVGPVFDQRLLAFKAGPNTMGPFLRLSATFSSANVAAMYFELALVFAVTGLIGSLGRRSRRWIAFTVCLAAVDILLVALLLTYSRGALLGLLAAALAMALAGREVWHQLPVIRRRAAMVVAVNFALMCGILSLSASPIELLRFSTQNDRAWYQATYVSRAPSTMIVGTTRAIPVTIQNRSPLTWSASSPRTYGLSYHWLRPSRSVVRFANPITWLSSDLRPGGRQTVLVNVKAPAVLGRYLLVWDMVWKGTTWFGAKTGTYRALPVRVIETEALAGTSPPVKHVAPPDIAYLPANPALDRGQIWAVAIRMLENRPLFGMGPQGVRMNYTAFAGSALPRKPPPHAHDLALEMLADWGVIGGGLFAALLAVLWWPLLRRVVSGRVEGIWELAVIGAAAALLGHELVDYFLTKQAAVVVLWLLCGLAATMPRGAPADVNQHAPAGRGS